MVGIGAKFTRRFGRGSLCSWISAELFRDGDLQHIRIGQTIHRRFALELNVVGARLAKGVDIQQVEFGNNGSLWRYMNKCRRSWLPAFDHRTHIRDFVAYGVGYVQKIAFEALQGGHVTAKPGCLSFVVGNREGKRDAFANRKMNTVGGELGLQFGCRVLGSSIHVDHQGKEKKKQRMEEGEAHKWGNLGFGSN